MFEIKLFFPYQNIMINVRVRYLSCSSRGFITLTRQTINKSQTFIRGPNQILHPFGIHVVFP